MDREPRRPGRVRAGSFKLGRRDVEWSSMGLAYRLWVTMGRTNTGGERDGLV